MSRREAETVAAAQAIEAIRAERRGHDPASRDGALSGTGG